jgi:dimethylaniline monooxygenase (N-oxide forming)
VKIAIVGAGPSGLATAAVLQEFGHEVVVFEKAPDIGGVWSATRSYPGLSTQDTRVTYAFSDVPMPEDFPEHPTGAHVRSYLEGYARVKGLLDRVRLSTRVESAEPRADGEGWTLQVTGPDGPSTLDVDWLVVANGVFSTPHVPDWPGREEFEAHGGRVALPTRLGSDVTFEDRRVVVVGWGKTACDVAAQCSRTATSTTVVARRLRWKIPKRISRNLTFRHLLLTRLGEHLMTAPRTSLASFTVAVVGFPARRTALWALRRSIVRSTGLQELGMMPDSTRLDSNSLVTDGFYEAIAEGRLHVRRQQTVESLGAVDGVPGVRLSDGSWLAADVVVPATGFDQELSVLSPAVQVALKGCDGTVSLYRRILPLDVPRLAFAGWGHTYRSPLTAEVGAVWLAGHLAGALRTQPRDVVERTADRYHLTHQQAAARGEEQLPSGSFAALDALLEDLDLPLPATVRRRQWVTPLEPSSYAYLVPALRRRLRLDDDPGTATSRELLADVAP